MADNKPVIETLINTTAIGLMSVGMLNLQSDGYRGFLLIGFAMSLEFFKYWGRKHAYW